MIFVFPLRLVVSPKQRHLFVFRGQFKHVNEVPAAKANRVAGKSDEIPTSESEEKVVPLPAYLPTYFP